MLSPGVDRVTASFVPISRPIQSPATSTKPAATTPTADPSPSNGEADAIAAFKQQYPNWSQTLDAFLKFRQGVAGVQVPQAVYKTTEFVPYETDSFAAADAKAVKEFVNKYPGARAIIHAFQGMRKQFLTV